MSDLARLMSSKSFDSQAEVDAFLKTISDRAVPKITDESRTLQQVAEDLVFDACEVSPTRARRILEDALQLDPDCISAYELLGDLEPSVIFSTVFFEKGVSIGRQKFGKAYQRENKGHFWYIHETRSFMRCMHSLADGFFQLGRLQESVSLMEEMLTLNPRDNQGVRFNLLLALVMLGDDAKFLKYEKQFKNEQQSFVLFTRALFLYKREGSCAKSKAMLQRAVVSNHFVIPMFKSWRRMRVLPNEYAFGSEEEAVIYVNDAMNAWLSVPGAIGWLLDYH